MQVLLQTCKSMALQYPMYTQLYLTSQVNIWSIFQTKLDSCWLQVKGPDARWNTRLTVLGQHTCIFKYIRLVKSQPMALELPVNREELAGSLVLPDKQKQKAG